MNPDGKRMVVSVWHKDCGELYHDCVSPWGSEYDGLTTLSVIQDVDRDESYEILVLMDYEGSGWLCDAPFLVIQDTGKKIKECDPSWHGRNFPVWEVVK